MLECTNQGKLHTHASVSEAMVCYGVIDNDRYYRDNQRARGMTSSAPVRADLSVASDAQVNYVGVLGGDVAAARVMSRSDCSTYIDGLKSGRIAPIPKVDEKKDDEEKALSKFDEAKIPAEMLGLLDEGYYASRLDDQDAWRFFYVSRPKSGQYKDTVKVQMQHGSGYGDGRWTPCYVAWPSGTVSVYDIRNKDHVMICISGPGQAMRDYAGQIGRCCRCNALLTDKRSLYYGIGPECEKKNPGLIEDVNLEKGEYDPLSPS